VCGRGRDWYLLNGAGSGEKLGLRSNCHLHDMGAIVATIPVFHTRTTSRGMAAAERARRAAGRAPARAAGRSGPGSARRGATAGRARGSG
jgi:predicted amidohydrolase YtcJ